MRKMRYTIQKSLPCIYLILGWCDALLVIDFLIRIIRLIPLLQVVQPGKNVRHNDVRGLVTYPASWYCWYSDLDNVSSEQSSTGRRDVTYMRSRTLLSASVNSISSMPSCMNQSMNARRLNIAAYCERISLARQESGQ